MTMLQESAPPVITSTPVGSVIDTMSVSTGEDLSGVGGDDDTSNESSSRASSFLEQTQQQLQKEQEFVKKETFRVNLTKLIVVLTIVAAGIACSVLTSKVIQREEKKDFSEAKEQYFREIKEVSQNSAGRAFTAIASLSKSITASAMMARQYEPNKTFPFYSMPYFHVQATETQRISGAATVIYSPLVRLSQKEQWEEYSVKNQGWVKQGLKYRGVDVVENDPGRIPTKVYNRRNPNQDGEDVAYNSAEQVHVPGEVHVENYIMPVWQMAGAPINASVVNMDLLATPFFEHTMVDVILTRKGILSQINDYHFLTMYSGTKPPPGEQGTNPIDVVEGGEHSTVMTSQDHKTNIDDPASSLSSEHVDPQTFMLEPVFDSFEPDAPVVGFIIAVFPWNTYFVNVLPAGVEVNLVVKDRCGHSYTWDINGGDVKFMGVGDLSRSDHAHQVESFEFAPYARHNQVGPATDHPKEFTAGWDDHEDHDHDEDEEVADEANDNGTRRRTTHELMRRRMGEDEVTSIITTAGSSSPEYVAQFGGTYDELFHDKAHVAHCSYVIELHPTVWFEIHYESDRPKVYAIYVVMVFGIILLFLLAFDVMVVRRQRKLMATARRTHAVVASLFPETVQKRILDDAAKKDELGQNANLDSTTKPIGKGSAQTASTRGGEFVYGSAPIADFFSSTTILFSDLAGFTAWSSTKEPTQVFQLLEKIYSSFDELARSRGVFKVETIGDCYLAACGLPEKRDDHAIVMARFARDCLTRYPKILREMERYLGPGVKALGLRTGLHSGPVTAGVLRGEKSRFQLFGDTVNTASRMESTGVKNRIQISHETMEHLLASGMKDWVQPRETAVTVKGKGELQTYWLLSRSEQAVQSSLAVAAAAGIHTTPRVVEEEEPTVRTVCSAGLIQ